MGYALLALSASAIPILFWRPAQQGKIAALLYRLHPVLNAYLAYFLLKPGLAAMNLNVRDGELHALDQLLFGQTPAVSLEHWTRDSALVEWFAAFYFGLYLLEMAYIFGVMLFEEGPRLVEFYYGLLILCACGFIGYTLVPALGPYAVLQFDGPIAGGTAWGLVLSAVESSGARLDVFPSLHTAIPLYFTAFAWRHRHARTIYRISVAPTAFVAINIIVATVVLRWHWGVDLLGGLALAVVCDQVGAVLASRQHQTGETLFPPLELRI